MFFTFLSLFFFRATSLGPKPSLFIYFVWCFFVFSFLMDKKLCCPLRQGHFLFILECLPLFVLSLFWPPPFSTFSFSVSLSILLFSFFFPSCLSFLLSFRSLFFSLSFLFFLLCFCFVKGTTSKNWIATFFPYIFSLFGFLSWFFSWIHFSHLCFCLILSYVFFNINVFGFKNQSWKHQFLIKRGVATKFFFMNLCFAKCEKLSFFFAHCWANCGWCSNKTLWNRYCSTFLETKNKNTILRCYYLGQVGVIIWAKLTAT